MYFLGVNCPFNYWVLYLYASNKNEFKVHLNILKGCKDGFFRFQF